ncbi:RecX family transcriptional regulator [Candidatus Parcubacteria bacterium]|nr:RecX family transcriptional regulator [Candidatus Parcubacteria bacterium]
MPVVTKIQQQQKRPGRYSVFVDDRFAVGLSANDLLASGLRRGQELSEAELEQLKARSRTAKAYEQALSYLSFRSRSSREMRDHLTGKGHDQAVVDEVAAELAAKGLLGDVDFAGAWIRDRQNLKPRSKRRLEQELRQKGLAPDTVAGALEAVSQEDERQALRTVASKKLALARYRDQRKLTQYLAAQGFEYGMVKQVLAELAETPPDR